MSAAGHLSTNTIYSFLVKYLYGKDTTEKLDLCLRGPIYSGHNSKIYYVGSSRLPYPCALKFCVHSRTTLPDLDAAKQQYSTLEKVIRALPSNSRYRVPRPYLLMESEGALLTEWINGKNLSNMLFIFVRGTHRAEDLMRQSAAWLRNFHESRRLQPGSLDTNAKLAVIENLSKQYMVKDELLSAGHSCLTALADSASDVELPRSWLHGDFKSDNIIVSNDHVYGIDVQARYENVVVYDHASFLNHIELSLNCLRYPLLSLYQQRLYRAFLDQYIGSTRTDIELPLLWVRLYLLLSGRATVHKTMHHSIRGRYLESLYRRATVKVMSKLNTLL